MSDLRLDHDGGPSLSVHCGPTELLRYVYEPTDAQLEAPRPYLHPLRTLGRRRGHASTARTTTCGTRAWRCRCPTSGRRTSGADRPTCASGGYQQLPNDGDDAPPGRSTGSASTPGRCRCEERLTWVTEPGRDLVRRAPRARWRVQSSPTPAPGCWRSRPGSSTSAGADRHRQPDHRGPAQRRLRRAVLARTPVVHRGTVHVPDGAGGDELMGVRAPWMAFTGTHDDARPCLHRGMVDAPDNHRPTRPSGSCGPTPFACLCPAPFFDTEVALGAGRRGRAPLRRRHRRRRR